MEKNKATGNIFFIHFIETLFSLNDYRLHPTYNQFPQTERERLLFSLKGNENKEYVFLFLPVVSHLFLFFCFIFSENSDQYKESVRM
jgi:hypothetical protein